MDAMSPSSALKVLTSGQIGKLEELFGAGLRKARLSSEGAQLVIETQAADLIPQLVSIVRNRVEVVSTILIRHVTVNRNRSPKQVIAATQRFRKTVSGRTVESMPRGIGEEVDVFFFRVGRTVTHTQLAEEYRARELQPADPYSLAAVNEADPTFADTYPNFTHWKDGRDHWCYMWFRRWVEYPDWQPTNSFDIGMREVRERSLDVDDLMYLAWGDWIWFAGMKRT